MPSDINWLDKMQGYLVWTLKGPDLHNPYAAPISDQTLGNMLSNPECLNDYIELKCSCDGHEVFTLKNLNKPTIVIGHPCIQALKKPEIIETVNRLGILEKMVGEIQNIQRSILEELRDRQKTKRQVVASNGNLTLREIKEKVHKERQAKPVELASAALKVPLTTIKTD